MSDMRSESEANAKMNKTNTSKQEVKSANLIGQNSFSNTKYRFTATLSKNRVVTAKIGKNGGVKYSERKSMKHDTLIQIIRPYLLQLDLPHSLEVALHITCVSSLPL